MHRSAYSVCVVFSSTKMAFERKNNANDFLLLDLITDAKAKSIFLENL